MFMYSSETEKNTDFLNQLFDFYIYLFINTLKKGTQYSKKTIFMVK